MAFSLFGKKDEPEKKPEPAAKKAPTASAGKPGSNAPVAGKPTVTPPPPKPLAGAKPAAPVERKAESVPVEEDDLDFTALTEETAPVKAGQPAPAPTQKHAKSSSPAPDIGDSLGADAAAAIAAAVSSMAPAKTAPAPAPPQAKAKAAAPAIELPALDAGNLGKPKSAAPVIEKTWMPEGRSLTPEKAPAPKAAPAPAAPSRPRGTASAGPTAPPNLTANPAAKPAPAVPAKPQAAAAPAAAPPRPAPAKPAAPPAAVAKPVAAPAPQAPARAVAPVAASASEPKLPQAIEQAALQFANGQSEAAVKILKTAIAAGNLGEFAAQAWLMLFDLYQALGRKEEHDESALQFVVKFERSAPAWRDEPKQAAKDPALQRGMGSHFALTGSLSKASKGEIDQLQKLAEKGALLRIEFGKLKDIDAEGAQLLLDTLKALVKARRELVLSSHKTLLDLLAPRTEVGNKENPHVYWMLLLSLYQVLGLQTEFDDVALNFAITYELSPPSFEEPAKAATAEVASSQPDAGGDDAIVLTGELCGSDDDELARFAKSAAARGDVTIDMTQVKRVDSAAADAMLKTILILAASNKPVQIRAANELVSALFQVVGISRYAKLLRRR